MEWIQMAQDRPKWMVFTVWNLEIPQTMHIY